MKAASGLFCSGQIFVGPSPAAAKLLSTYGMLAAANVSFPRRDAATAFDPLRKFAYKACRFGAVWGQQPFARKGPPVKSALTTGLAALAAATAVAQAQSHDAPTGQPMSQGMMGSPGMMGQGMMGHRMMMSNMARHHQYIIGGVASRYRSARNPLPYDEQTMRRGAAVYAQACSACHGASGLGDGPAAKGLNPPPANLRWGSGMHMMRGDSFLYWTIEEGGAPVGSAMPAFKRALPEKDVWAVVTYVQHGLESANHRHCCGR